MIGTHPEQNVIILTSFNPGSGKSHLAGNIAMSLAIKKKKVLVIDGDLRLGSTSMLVGSPGEDSATISTAGPMTWRASSAMARSMDW